jgi:hypothetical protein
VTEAEKTYQKGIKILTWIFIGLIAWPFMRSISTNNDLNIFYGAAQRLVSFENLYSKPYSAEGWQLYYYYSPLFATLLAPFTFLPQFIVTHEVPFGLFILKILWNCLNLYFVYQLFQFVRDLVSAPKNKAGLTFWIVLALVSYRWIFLNLLYGQMTILIVWGVVRAFQFLQSKSPRYFTGLAFGVNLKILPIFMVGQLFLMKEWRAFVITVSLVIAMILLPFVYLPFQYHLELLQSWMMNINPFSKNHIVELGEGGFIDFGALVTKYLTGLNIEGEDRVAWFSMGASGVFFTTQIFRLVVLSSCCYWVWKFRNLRNHNNTILLMSIFLASIPLAFPHQRDYSLLMMWPMVLFVVKDWLMNVGDLSNENSIPKSIKLGLFTGAFLMGLIVFFEALPFDIRAWISGYRIQGIGGLIFLLYAHLYLGWKVKKMQHEKTI